MKTNLRRGAVAALAVLFILPVLCLADDVAQCFPADTPVYVGWSAAPAPAAAPTSQPGEFDLVAVALRVANEKADAEVRPLVAFLQDVWPVLKHASGGVGWLDMSVVDDEPQFQAALVLSGVPDGEKLATRIVALIKETGGPDVDTQTVHGVSLHTLALPHMERAAYWGTHKSHFIIALGETTAGKIVDCLNGEAPTLAEAAELKLDRGKVKADTAQPFICLFADVQRIVTRAMEIGTQLEGPPPPEVEKGLTELGIHNLRSKYVHWATVDGQDRLSAYVHVDGPPRGLVKLWEQKPLTDADLKLIPAQARWACLSNFDLAALWGETRRVIDEMAPEAMPAIEGMLAMTASILGFSITDDLLPALGDTWALYDAPSHGGFLVTGIVLVADVPDEKALAGMLERLVQCGRPLLAQADATPVLCETTDNGHTIHYLLLGGLPVPVAPAWGFVDGRMALGLYPQAVAQALRQADPKTRKGSLMDNADVQAARKTMPAEIQAFGYLDTRYYAEQFYPFVNAIQTAAISTIASKAGAAELPLLPPVDEYVADVKTSFSATSHDSDGILNISSGAGASVGAAVAAAALSVSVLLPSLSRARGQAHTAVQMANLRGVGMAAMIYANDHDDQMPATLDELVKAELVTAEHIDPDNDNGPPYAFISYPVRLSRVKSPATSILAYRWPAMDGKALALFLDGHVEAMPIERFKPLLRATYTELDREAEIPPQFRD